MAYYNERKRKKHISGSDFTNILHRLRWCKKVKKQKRIPGSHTAREPFGESLKLHSSFVLLQIFYRCFIREQMRSTHLSRPSVVLLRTRS